MKSLRETIEIRSREKVEIIDITAEVESVVERSSIADGFALVFPHHTSMAVYVSDSDRSLTHDMEDVLDRIAPSSAEYRHDSTDPKRNAHAHLKATLTGHHIILPVTEGKLDFGIYQTIYCAEFDGQRAKEILVKVCGA